MSATQDVTLAAPLTAREVFQSLLQADRHPGTGNEDVPVAIAMTRDALGKATMAVLFSRRPTGVRAVAQGNSKGPTSVAMNKKRSSGRFTTISNRRATSDGIENHAMSMG